MTFFACFYCTLCYITDAIYINICLCQCYIFFQNILVAIYQSKKKKKRKNYIIVKIMMMLNGTFN